MSDLFKNIDKLYTKEPIEDPSSDFILHRFLASRQEYAEFVKEISLNIRDSDMVWALWQKMLPKAPRSPCLKYPAAKKEHPDDSFIEGLMGRFGWSIHEAREYAELIDMAGQTEEVANYYGIELE